MQVAVVDQLHLEHHLLGLVELAAAVMVQLILLRHKTELLTPVVVAVDVLEGTLRAVRVPVVLVLLF
jgi:hypothetical protein